MMRDKRSESRPKKRMVWRITDAAPQGEIVNLNQQVVRPPPSEAPTEPSQPGWAMSSFELLHGVEVSEEDPSTVPAELIDELFKKPGR